MKRKWDAKMAALCIAFAVLLAFNLAMLFMDVRGDFPMCSGEVISKGRYMTLAGEEPWADDNEEVYYIKIACDYGERIKVWKVRKSIYDQYDVGDRVSYYGKSRRR